MERRAKLALAAIVGFAGIATLLVVVAAVILFHSKTLTRDLLSAVSARTGCQIRTRRIALHFTPTGVELAVNHLSATCKGDAATSRQVIATVGYGALLRLHPLPLDYIVLVNPHARLKASRAKFSWPKETAQPAAFARVISGLARNVVISGGQVIFSAADGQSAQNSQLELDGRIGSSTQTVRAWISHLAWYHAGLSGISMSGRTSIATSRDSATPARATLTLATAQAIPIRATLNLALSGAGILKGTAAIEMSQVPTLGQAGFDGSFSLSEERMEISGTISTSADFATTRRIPLNLTLTLPFSPNPLLSANTGALGLRLAALFEAMGSANGPAGTISFSSLRLDAPVGAWHQALAQCSNPICRHRQALRMLLEQTRISLALASANLDFATAPSDLRTLQVQHEVDFTLEHGVLASRNVSAQIGALQIVDGMLRLKDSISTDGVLSSIRYQTAFPLSLQLSQLDLSHLPRVARNLLKAGALLYARARSSGEVTMHNRRPRLRVINLQLSEGLLRLQNRHIPRTVFFNCRARLSHHIIRTRARVLTSDSGTLALNSSLRLRSRRLRAQIRLSHLDLQRWSATMVQAGMPQGFRVGGQIGGLFAVHWQPSERPIVNGSMHATALMLASPFVNGPVNVRQTRLVLQGSHVSAALNGITMGNGAINLRADVQDFVHPAIEVALSGQRLDLNAINVDRLTSSAHGSSSPSRPIKLSANIDLHEVLLRGASLTDVKGELGNQGGVWRVRTLTGHTLHGSFLVAGTWRSQAHFLHIIGGVHRIDARRLFSILGYAKGGRPPLTGQLSSRVNAGLLMGAGQPRLSCGGATIAISDGTLGRADVLARMMEVMSLENWLKFRPPDLERSGLPFRKISARLAFAPDLLKVEHVQLAGAVIRVAGHGSVTVPGNVLDLHLAVLPFTSAHWILEQLPLIGTRLANTYDRAFAARLRVTGPANALNISPELLRTTTGALVAVLELPIDFVPQTALPDATSLTLPPPTSADWPDCVPPWSVKPHGSARGTVDAIISRLMS
ncbi:MAG TPA: AsmA-like C-terminal domain-containing protein [Candidatus Binataceae bacterium]|nr:AsmA-like C-terminal domain-containing protein [Candidatus Binataceae bacterium]